MIIAILALATQLAAPSQTQPSTAIVEQAVRKSLRDPDSAKFDWPSGFVWGSYHVPGSLIGGKGPTYEGWFICGTVNARNSYGGYAGATPLIAVVKNDEVTMMDVADSEYSGVPRLCQKMGLRVR